MILMKMMMKILLKILQIVILVKIGRNSSKKITRKFTLSDYFTKLVNYEDTGNRHIIVSLYFYGNKGKSLILIGVDTLTVASLFR